MKTRLAVVSVLSAVALLTVCSVYAGPGEMGRGSGLGKGASVWNDLSKEQKDQATVLRLDFMKKANELMAQMGKKRIELLESTSVEKPDEQAIQKKREEMWALQDAMRNERRAMGSKFRAILTPEQREKIGPLGPGMGGGCGFGGRGEGFSGGRGCMGGGFGRMNL